MSRGYDQLAWVDYPETLTPISAANLNRMENGIANLYTDRNKLESNMAYVEDGDTSSRHYDIDAYLMHNGVFYKVTEEINIGDTLDYGLDGNIAHVDISSQFGSGGGGSTGCVELTQAEYDALSEDEKMDDVLYLITDSPEIKYKKKTYAGASEAERITYDNTQSGLTAGNVQDAVDEVNSKLQHIKKAKVYDANISVSTASTDVTFSFPADYHSSLGIVLANSWPLETWDPTACVSIRRDSTVHGNQAKVTLSSTKTQSYNITLYLLYI